MNPLLDGPRAKLERGLEHITALRAEYEATFGTGSEVVVEVDQRLDRTTSEWVVTLGLVPEPSARLGLIAGDAVHNFRSALDHLVLNLAVADSGSEPRQGRTQFPIVQRREDFASKRVQEQMLEGVDPRHREMLERHQPYHAAEHDPEAVHPLAVLNDLDDDDKHRTIQPAFIAADDFGMRIPPEGQNCEFAGSLSGTTPLGRPMESGTEVLRMPLRVTGPDPRIDIQCRASLSLVFRNGLPVLQALEVMGSYVACIIEEFAPDLGTPEAMERWKATEGRFRSTPRLEGHRVTITAVPHEAAPGAEL